MPWIFVVILIVVAGLVAAGGDRMGHRAARSRIRIGKLRPRHAATLISVVTGVLISLVTYGVVFALWRDFRDALLHYDEVKGRLASVQGEFDQSKRQLAESEQRRHQAQADQAKADAEISRIQAQMIEITKSLSAAQKQLDDASVQVAQSKGQLHDLNERKVKLQADIDSYKARLDDMRNLVTQTRGELETHQQGALLVAKGTCLAYIQLEAGEAASLSSKLQVSVARLRDSLGAMGIELDDASDQAAAEFISSYPVSESRSVTLVKAASNVVQGEKLLLAFEARELKPLVSAGEVVMDVLVTGSSARVRMKGLGERTIDVPAEFDASSLADFGAALIDIFDEGARKLGFLPSLPEGSIDNPVESLADVAADLAVRERPFVVQFVAKGDADALDGLQDAQIYISNPAGAP